MTEPTTTKDTRIPSVLSRNPILTDFFRQYLSVLDAIAGYNSEVLAEKDSEWTLSKVLEKARELGRPTDANVEANKEIQEALDKWEDLVTQINLAKRNVLDITAKAIGIPPLSSTAVRDPELEAPLKEKRKLAVEIGNQLKNMAGLLQDDKISDAMKEFLVANPLPTIGRDQVRTFGDNEKSTPKYRVQVVVTDADGNVKVDESGFTKASLALTKFYEHGKALKADKLREAWEAVGNNADKTVVNPVEFDDNNLHFTITKK